MGFCSQRKINYSMNVLIDVKKGCTVISFNKELELKQTVAILEERFFSLLQRQDFILKCWFLWDSKAL